MTLEEKELLKETIRKNIAELKEELDELEVLIKPIAPDVAIGRLSRLDAMNNQLVNKASYADKKTLLDRLKLSLNVIDKAEYGTCAKCNSQIPLKRLMSVPYSPLCVPCSVKFR